MVVSYALPERDRSDLLPSVDASTQQFHVPFCAHAHTTPSLDLQMTLIPAGSFPQPANCDASLSPWNQNPLPNAYTWRNRHDCPREWVSTRVESQRRGQSFG